MGKDFKKQAKTIKDQGKEQTKTIIEQEEKQIKAIESNKGVDNEAHKIFDELSHEIMKQIKDLSRQIDLNNLTFYFKNKSISLINFIGFKAPLHLYRDIFGGNIELAKAENYQKQFKLNLNEIAKENPKKKSENQTKTIENIKNLYEPIEKVFIF